MMDQRANLAYCAKQGIVVEAYGAIGADGVLEQPLVRELVALVAVLPQLAAAHDKVLVRVKGEVEAHERRQ